MADTLTVRTALKIKKLITVYVHSNIVSLKTRKRGKAQRLGL